VIEARLVWDTWRRILTSDALVDAVLEPPDDFASLGLTPAETAILADYAGTPAATDQTIFMYRNGLVRNALCSLHLVPLSNRLLHTCDLDAKEVARDFTASIGYRDDGPNGWRLAAAFVAYLAKLPELAGGAKKDALSIDAAAIALIRSLAELPPASWPDDAVLQPALGEGAHRNVASRAAAVTSTRYDLTPWLENPFTFDVEATLDLVESHWLIYLPNPNAAHTYAELSERAARAFTQLAAAPKSASQVAAELDLAVADVQEVIDSLGDLGVVTIESARP
jgi:hypothetical protein